MEGVEGVQYLCHDPCHTPMKTYNPTQVAPTNGYSSGGRVGGGVRSPLRVGVYSFPPTPDALEGLSNFRFQAQCNDRLMSQSLSSTFGRGRLR
jgi:hypothetical protein